MNLNLLVIKSMYEFNWRRPVLCLSDLLTLEGKGQVSKHTRGFLFVGWWSGFDINKFITMNRFKIVIGRESDFEDIWKNRETHLDNVKGFRKFNLLKGFST